MTRIPAVTIDQMRTIDRMMVEEIGVTIQMMMEHAGRAVAFVTREILRGNVAGKQIMILVGKGNNGGDGLAAARHLMNWGARIRIFLASSPEKLSPDAKAQYDILKNIHANIDTNHENLSLHEVDLIIDALLGYNLQGDPREPYASMIRAANTSNKPILAIDIPSGLNGDSGKPSNPTIKAAATLTLALPKVGLKKKDATSYVGKLHLTDLTIPQVVYEKLGLKNPNPFGKNDIVSI